MDSHQQIQRRLRHLCSTVWHDCAKSDAAAAAVTPVDVTPFEWGPEEWQRLEEERQPIFDKVSSASH